MTPNEDLYLLFPLYRHSETRQVLHFLGLLHQSTESTEPPSYTVITGVPIDSLHFTYFTSYYGASNLISNRDHTKETTSDTIFSDSLRIFTCTVWDWSSIYCHFYSYCFNLTKEGYTFIYSKYNTSTLLTLLKSNKIYLYILCMEHNRKLHFTIETHLTDINTYLNIAMLQF